MNLIKKNLIDAQGELGEEMSAFKQQQKILTQPHKIVNGIAVALTKKELAEFNKPQPKEEIIANLKQVTIAARQKILKDNDWRFSKQVRTGEPVDPKIVAILNKYNEEINEIEKFTSIAQFKKLTQI